MKSGYTNQFIRTIKGKRMGRTVLLASTTMFIMFLMFSGEYSAYGATTGGMQPAPADGSNSAKEDCNDHDACTIDYVWPGWGCVYEFVDCDDGDACTTDDCDPATGCFHEWVNCDDDNACTMDSCDADTGCVHEPFDCNDYNPSTIDTCDPLTGACINTPLNCDDNNVCTIDTTDGLGGCLHTPIDCDDGNPGTQDLCDPAIGCIHPIPPQITTVSPTQGPVSGGIEITIDGMNFVSNGTPQVFFDETPATNVQVYYEGYGHYHITCFLPAHSPGTAEVTVINPDGGRDTRAAAFTYVKNHPADLDYDLKMRMGEAIAYLSGWQGGANPMAYAIRAAYLWQNGEGYHYDAAEAPPMCWAPGPEIATIVLPGGVPLELVRIPAGSFQMGSPDTERGRGGVEGPVHTVTIGYDFYMGKYEVTQAQWLAVMGSSPGGHAWDYGQGATYPAYYVSWDDAQTFITTLNTLITNTGQGPATVRLPSEAEWEYACRAGTQTRFYFGDSLSVPDDCQDDGVRSRYMWYCGNNSPYGSKPVGGKLPNAFGLHDMSGNLWEWCEDDSHENYTGAPSNGSAWIDAPRGSYRVFRGGGWYDEAWNCRSAVRRYDLPSFPYSYGIGFRLAR